MATGVGLVGIFSVLRLLSAGGGSCVAPGSTTASGNCSRILRTSGSADSRMEKMCSGPARKSAIALIWIATVEYSRQSRCLMVALSDEPSNPRTWPSQCMAATTNPVPRVKIPLPVDGVVLVAPGHMPDRRAGQRDGPVPVLSRTQAVVGVVPLDEQRQRLAQSAG